jgi:Zn-dependent peptidase ImmA (M78 family)
MQHFERKRIEEITAVIRKTTKTLTAPFDIEYTITQVGGTIRKIKTNKHPKSHVKKTGGNEFEIQTNHTLIPQQRYDLATSLGHLFLHKKFAINEETWNNWEIGSTSETKTMLEMVESEIFANAFLLPENEFRDVCENNRNAQGYYLTSKIAEHFNVTTSIARLRGNYLGLFDYISFTPANIRNLQPL